MFYGKLCHWGKAFRFIIVIAALARLSLSFSRSCKPIASRLHFSRNFQQRPANIYQTFSTMKRTKSEIKEKEQLDASPKRRRTSKSAVVEEDKAEGSGAEEAPVSPAKSKARGSADDRASHIRDVVKPFPLRDEFDYLKVISWNVNGLNALVSSKKHVLDQLIDNHAPDVMFLQETKIQEPMEGDYADLVHGYHAIFSSSTVKKGYSGTVSRSDVCATCHDNLTLFCI